MFTMPITLYSPTTGRHTHGQEFAVFVSDCCSTGALPSGEFLENFRMKQFRGGHPFNSTLP
jgi:hypothetical protein